MGFNSGFKGLTQFSPSTQLRPSAAHTQQSRSQYATFSCQILILFPAYLWQKDERTLPPTFIALNFSDSPRGGWWWLRWW